MAASSEFQYLRSLLSPGEIIDPEGTSYKNETITWQAQKQLHPQLLIRPATLDALSKVVRYLCQSSLSFQVRTSGAGGGSADDVLISLRAFSNVDFDREAEVVYLGAGALWGEYYTKMEEIAPAYTVVAARTPFIGVGGSILCGGYSWISGDYGCISDPANLLDAQVVKLDGSVVWASEEPDLLWGLRGSAALGLGVVTQYKLKARKYSQQIWGGQILIPRNRELEVACGVAAMDIGENHPGVAMFLYVLKASHGSWFGVNEDMLIVHAFDSNGEDHGRAMFDWALKLKGAIDTTKILNLRGFADLQAPMAVSMSAFKQWNHGSALGRMTEHVILDSFRWWDKVQKEDGSIPDASMLIFELFSTCPSTSSPSESAYPRPKDYRHMLLLGAGCAPDAPAREADRAYQIIQEAPKEILGDLYDESRTAPNGLEAFHNFEAIYGQNWDKLVQLKKTYDPGDRLKGLPRITV